MFAGSPSERAEALAEALRDGLRVRTPTSSTRTPTSGFAFGESDCAICQSPLDRTRPEATANPDKVELATGLACRHVFHQCCLRRCREHDIRKFHAGERAGGARAAQGARSHHREESQGDGCDSFSAREANRKRRGAAGNRSDRRGRSNAGDARDGFFESRYGLGRVRGTIPRSPAARAEIFARGRGERRARDFEREQVASVLSIALGKRAG
ncbi:hypothetical protein BE221DRAFT_74344 [Ostreococcus tauri]|uniref:Zinc finger RING-H2-type domain-containing protein n=1 Tax=Ostreococcus tauri TaxID=70448 RepID=A0A1Y5IEJ9_OSTTA|nr:hypothetical protein BE221DRAFT_74344 [Ostreococcus tauri]